MNFKRLLSVTALLMLLSFPSFASMVSFLVVETGLGEEIAGTQYPSLWEGALMSAFFDAGHIVTNCPVARMEKKPDIDITGTIKAGFIEAIEGGVDYFILGFLEHRILGGIAVPVNITIKLYKTDSQELIFEQSFPIDNDKSLSEEYQFAQNVGWILISNIKDN